MGNIIRFVIMLSFLISQTSLAVEVHKNTHVIEDKIAAMKMTLPEVSSPIANYLPYLVIGKFVYISGQLPIVDKKVKYVGRLGANLSEEQGAAAAKLCALNILAQLKAAVGSLDQVKRCVKLTGFVNSSHAFNQQPKVLNGASDLIVNIFGEKGKHTRSAVGVAALPMGAAVEVEAIFEIE